MLRKILLSLSFIISTSLVGTPAAAQTPPAIQELQGNIEIGEPDVYLLEGLKAGQTVYA